MNEDAVRALVRELIARHLSGPAAGSQAAPSSFANQLAASGALPLAWHASHARHAVSSGDESDGPCFIEPAVRCNHCGYCQSHGH